jgi:hypothetical protein
MTGVSSTEPAEVRTELAEVETSPLPPIEWTYRPWEERPLPARMALLGTAVLIGALLTLRLPGLAVLVLAAAIAITLAPAWTPRRCRVDEEGVHARGPFGWEHRPWTRIRRARVLPPGALVVSPYRRRRHMDRFRALVLPFPDADRTRISAAITPHLEIHGY